MNLQMFVFDKCYVCGNMLSCRRTATNHYLTLPYRSKFLLFLEGTEKRPRLLLWGQPLTTETPRKTPHHSYAARR